MKLEEDKILAIMKAFEDLVTQAERHFDVDVDAVIQIVRLFWSNLDVAHLEQALS